MAEIKRVAHKIEYHVETTAGSGTYTQIANVQAINDHEVSRDEVDMTCLANTVEAMYPGPVLKVGELKLTLFWDEANTDTQGLLSGYVEVDPQPATDLKHKLVFPFADGTVTKIYDGWISSLGEIVYSVGSEVTREVTIKVTSIPVTS